MTTLSIQRTVAGVLTSADSATVTVTDSTGAVVVNAAAVTPTSAGVYSYNTTYLTPGVYTVTWTFVRAGQPNDVITRTFTADGPATLDTGHTLMAIEQRLAARLGPYYKKRVSAGSSTGLIVCNSMKSSKDRGGMEDLFILRRGRMTDGSYISNFNSDDRQREIASFDPTTGSLVPDRVWNVAPAINEEFELHALDPENELRPCVQWGLERCFFWDTATISTSGGLREYNLSSSVPWIKSTAQVRGISSSYPNSVIPPTRELWYDAIYKSGSVYLHTNWTGAVSLSVVALRPHSSYVNKELSFTGPNDDDDMLYVDMEYILASAHVQCWINFTDRLTTLAALGLRLTSTQVSARFTDISAQIAREMPEYPRVRWETGLDLAQVGNVGENPS